MHMFIGVIKYIDDVELNCLPSVYIDYIRNDGIYIQVSNACCQYSWPYFDGFPNINGKSVLNFNVTCVK